jgi:ubiquinone/menaquinone biosynthesis C-methylase UbiE
MASQKVRPRAFFQDRDNHPTTPPEEKMTEQSWNPQTLLELSNGYWHTCALHAAVKLDLFSALSDQALRVEELAEKIGVDRDGLERLLAALVAMKLLLKNDGRFYCTWGAAEFLSRQSPRYLGHIIRHHHQLMDSWAHLDEAVKSGGPVRQPYAGDDPEWRKNFLMGMFDLAMLLAPKLVGQIDLAGRRRLLDLGGGPGTWAIHFCRENPGLEAIVYDLPTTRGFAEETIVHFDLKDRISFVAGDFLEEELAGSYDVAWLSHILHGEGPQGVRTILDKTASVLEPGGLLLIHEFLLDDDLDGPLFPALFSLNMLLGTSAGRAYSGRQLFDQLQEAGFRDARRLALDLPGASSVIAATV